MTTALPQFPVLPGLAFPVVRTNMGFDVIKLQSISGARSRLALRNVPQYQWTLSFGGDGFLRDDASQQLTPFSDKTTFSDGSEFASYYAGELATLFGFYNQCYGPELPFVYTDITDNSTVLSAFGIGDGATTAFQLARSYGGFTEPVFAPVLTASTIPLTYSQSLSAPAPTIFVAGSVASGVSISQTGVVRFASAPAAGAQLAWTGSFQWLCRFDDDSLEFSNFMLGLWELKKLTFSNEILP